MMDRLTNSINELKQNKCYMTCFILYIIFEIAIGVEFCQHVRVIQFSQDSKFFSGYPTGCSDFVNDACVRTDLLSAECRGQQTSETTPLVFEATMGEMGKVLPQCIDEVTMDKFNYGMVTFEPVYDRCEYKTTRQTNEDLVTSSFTKF